MNVKLIGRLRGNGLAYYVFESSRNISQVNIQAELRIAGFGALDLHIQCIDVGFAHQTEQIRFITILPLLKNESGSQKLMVRDAQSQTVLYSETIHPEFLKWESRFNYHLHRPVEQYGNIDKRRSSNSVLIEPVGCYPYDEDCYIYRCKVDTPCSSCESEWLFPLYADGAYDHAIYPICLEDSTFKRTDETLRRHFTLSFKVSRKSESALLLVKQASEETGRGYLGITGEECRTMFDSYVEFARDAEADESYQSWFLKHRAAPETLLEQRSCTMKYSPLISIIIPVYNPPASFLEEAVQSITMQTYANWELVLIDASPEGNPAQKTASQLGDNRIKCIETGQNRGIAGNTNIGISYATGDFIAFVDQDDIIEPNALFEYVRKINETPDAGLLYCDEDSFFETLDHLHAPKLKPDFNRDLLYSHNYIVHMLMVSRSALQRAELSPDYTSGAQDYDLALKISEQNAPIVHVPEVLYHWRQHAGSTNAGNIESKPYAEQAGIFALNDHFKRRRLDAVAEKTRSPYVYRVAFKPPVDSPKVSIIIPTKDHVDLLDTCVRSIFEKAGYENFELILVENNSTDTKTFEYYNRLKDSDPRIRVIDFEGPFNYSKIVNFGARHASGEYLLFLNNDTKAISNGFLGTLLGYFTRPETGVIGCLLYYPDDLVQHAGLALMQDGYLGFMNQNHRIEDNAGYLGSLECGYDYSAVLGACQMVSKKLFDSLGGYCEDLAITYNDVDFCWRIREQGKLVIYTPYVQFYHYEFASRSRDNADESHAIQTEYEAGLMRMKWPRYFALGDPCLPPNCSKNSPCFKLG